MMNQQLSDSIRRAVYTVLRNAKGADPITLAEKIGAVVDFQVEMYSAEEGIAAVPAELTEPIEQEGPFPWDERRKGPVLDKISQEDIPPARSAVVPLRPKESRLLTLPGDADFHEPPAPKPVPSSRVISAGPIARAGKRRPGANIPETQYWSYEDLSAAVTSATPDSITFVPNGMEDEGVKVTAERNVHCKIGLGSVELTYRHPSMGEGYSAPSGPFDMGRVVIDLVAKHSFSLYDKDIDIDKALAGVVEQLKGLYKRRSENMEPTAIGPEPDLAMELSRNLRSGQGMKADHSERTQGGWNMVVDTHGSVLDQISRENASLAPITTRKG